MWDNNASYVAFEIIKQNVILWNINAYDMCRLLFYVHPGHLTIDSEQTIAFTYFFCDACSWCVCYVRLLHIIGTSLNIKFKHLLLHMFDEIEYSIWIKFWVSVFVRINDKENVDTSNKPKHVLRYWNKF